MADTKDNGTPKPPTMEEMVAKLAALEAENKRLAATHTARVTLKVSDKGGVSMYGLGRFPVTLYASQWLRVIENMPTIKAFITANAGQLASKNPSEAESLLALANTAK